MKENIDYKEIRETPPIVYVIQEIAGTRDEALLVQKPVCPRDG